MAEPENREGDELTDATPEREPSQEQVIQSEPLTMAHMDKLVAAVRQAIRPDLQEVGVQTYQNIEKRITPLEQVMAELREGLGDTQETRALVQQLLEEQMTPERAGEVREAITQRVKTVADQRRLKQTEAELERIRGASSPEQQANAISREYIWPAMQRYAQKQGLEINQIIAEIGPKFPEKYVPTAGDPLGVQGFLAQVEQLIDEVSDRRSKEARPVVRNDGERPAGGGPRTRFTRDELAEMTPEEYGKVRAALFKKKGR